MSEELKVIVLDDSWKNKTNDFVNNSKWGDILQFWQWAQIKSQEGWKVLRVGVLQSGELVLFAQILYKKASILGNYAYIPHGPIFQNVATLNHSLPVFNEFIRSIAAKYNFFTLEIEPKIGNFLEDSHPKELEYFSDPKIIEAFEKSGYAVTGRNMQPKYKLYYDLNLTEEELLACCQKSTRYNVRLAQKKGVEVKEYLPNSPEINDKIKVYYDLLLETQKRAKGYPIRSLDSFQKMFEVFKNTGESPISLFEASYNGETIAINISQRTKHWSSSFYAASNRLYSEVKAMYLLRWKSVMKAKESGSSLYDFWGIIPNSSQHAGYSDHKLSFGGIRLDTNGLLALPLKPFQAFVWDKGIPMITSFKKHLRIIKN